MNGKTESVDPGFDVLADVRALLIDTNKRDAVLVELLSMFKELGVKVDKVTAFEERLNLDHERLARVESMLAFYLQNISAQVDALALDASGKPQKMTVPLHNLWMQAWSQFLKSKGGAQNETRKD